jgi:hypothetical protein
MATPIKRPDPPVEPTRPSLAAKLAKVVMETTRVEKRGHNDFHGYDYATAADVLDAVRKHLAEQHVIIVPRITGSSVIEKPRENKSPQFITTVEVTYAVIDGESNDMLEIPWRGCGEDSGDKGLYKALTGGYKYLLFQLFMIPTGDDPERDKKSKRADAIPASGDVSKILDLAAAIEQIDGRTRDEIIQKASYFLSKKDGKPYSFTDPTKVSSAKVLEITRQKLEAELHALRGSEPGAAEGATPFK